MPGSHIWEVDSKSAIVGFLSPWAGDEQNGGPRVLLFSPELHRKTIGTPLLLNSIKVVRKYIYKLDTYQITTAESLDFNLQQFMSGISQPLSLFHPMEAMAHFWMINMRILPDRPYGMYQINKVNMINMRILPYRPYHMVYFKTMVMYQFATLPEGLAHFIPMIARYIPLKSNGQSHSIP